MLNPDGTEMTPEQELAALRAENEKLKAERANASNHTLSCKVATSGGVSVYGLGRFPVTLYGEQWARLLGYGKEIITFITVHQSELATDATKAARKAEAKAKAAAAA